MKKIFLFLFLNTLLLARYEAIPIQNCEVFNNMKHTKNTDNIYLDTTKKYTILRSYKEQNLLLIKGVNPAQRWVDERCFIKSTSHSKMKEAKVGQNLLALSWHNAFCETHRYKKECKVSKYKFKEPYSSTHFILHGLWPQPRSNQYCNVSKKDIGMDKNRQWSSLPSLKLSSITESSLKEIMPGFRSSLHKHEWIKHGTCYKKSADIYFKDAISLTKQFNASIVGRYLSSNIGRVVYIKDIRKLFEYSFGKGTGERVELKCKNGLITELWLHLGSGEESLAYLLLRGKKVKSRCQRGRLDRIDFDR